MTDDATLERLINATYPNPDGSGTLGISTRAIVIDTSLAAKADSLVKDLELGRTMAVVSDPNTFEVMGEDIEKSLSSLGRVIPLHLDSPHGDMGNVELVRKQSREADVLVAVGAGVINDICKYAAFLDNKPYVVFGTAPSMNGYTSVNAAIMVKGHKKSLKAAAPQGVFLDLDVLSKAPRRMVISGLGDSLCRPTAQADWMLSHYLLDTPYKSVPFDLLAEDENELFENAKDLISGDREVMARLARTLVLSGIGMTLSGGSYPASEGEHLIAHYIEMMGGDDLPYSFHGEQIAVTTLSMAGLQENMLNRPCPEIHPTSTTRADVLAHFGEGLGEACWQEFQHKVFERHDAKALQDRLSKNWDKLSENISRIHISSARLTNIIEAVGGPVHPKDLGWPDPLYKDALVHARELRNRYTFLDLAADSGNL